jgi:hypothetical protein
MGLNEDSYFFVDIIPMKIKMVATSGFGPLTKGL